MNYQTETKNIAIDKQDNTLTGADGVRAIACLLVIFHHMAQRIESFSKPDFVRDIISFFLLGNTGVSFFFVLSGFLLSYPFWKQYMNNAKFPGMKNFFIRRAARIMPGYYAAFFAALLLTLLIVPDSYLFNNSISRSEHFWPKLLTGLTFTSGFHYTTLFPSIMDSPLWSISFEVFCYFLLPLFMAVLFYFTGKKRSFLKAIIFWIGVEIFIIFINGLIHQYLTPDNIRKGWEFGLIGGSKKWMPNYNPVGFFAQFALGIMAAGVTFRLSRPSGLKDRFYRNNGFDILSIIFLVSIVFLLWSMRYMKEFSFSLQHQPYYFPFLTVLIAGLLVSLSHSRRMGKFMDNPFFKYTAKISFGLYIWHWLVLVVISNLWFNNYIYTFYMIDWKEWLEASVLLLIISYIVASASYYFLEKPFLDRVHQSLTGKQIKVKSRMRIKSLATALVLSVLAVIFIYPLIWLVDASLRPSLESTQVPPVMFQKPVWEAVKTYTRDGYTACFLYLKFGNGLFNSLVITTSAIALTLFVCSLFAYALAFVKYPGKKFFLIVALSTMMIPINTLFVSIYKVLNTIHLINNWLALIFIYSVSGLGVFLLRQYFIKIPTAFIESARIDGANHFQTWWHVALPLAKPALATLAIIQFRYAWNDFLLPMIVLRNDYLFTLPIKILGIGGGVYGTTNVIMAAGVITVIVPLAFFFKFQRQFIESLTSGLKR